MLVFFSGMARINSLGNSDGKKPHNIEFRICFQIAEFNFKNKCIINVTIFIDRKISIFTLNFLNSFPRTYPHINASISIVSYNLEFRVILPVITHLDKIAFISAIFSFGNLSFRPDKLLVASSSLLKFNNFIQLLSKY